MFEITNSFKIPLSPVLVSSAELSSNVVVLEAPADRSQLYIVSLTDGKSSVIVFLDLTVLLFSNTKPCLYRLSFLNSSLRI